VKANGRENLSVVQSGFSSLSWTVFVMSAIAWHDTSTPTSKVENSTQVSVYHKFVLGSLARDKDRWSD
jgi:hypothetical protein